MARVSFIVRFLRFIIEFELIVRIPEFVKPMVEELGVQVVAFQLRFTLVGKFFS